MPGEVHAQGDLPLTFELISRDLTNKSKAAGAGDLPLDPLFQIPIELVHNAVGYRSDEPSQAFEGRFVVLDPINPTLMQRLFGGRDECEGPRRCRENSHVNQGTCRQDASGL